MKNLTSYHLKIIAMITMVIDHSCKIFSLLLIQFLGFLENQNVVYCTYYFIEGIGRISFILFAFMIAEGCRHTHDIQKYVGRLLLFALISEFPFQWMISIITGTSFAFSLTMTNIFFTLALGAIAIAGYQFFLQKALKKWIPLILCSLVSLLIQCDYHIFGVITIFICYYFQDTKKRSLYLTILMVIQYLIYDPIVYGIGLTFFGFDPSYLIYFGYTCVSLFIIKHYNGKRGKPIKYFSYAFYPLHLLILCFLYYYL